MNDYNDNIVLLLDIYGELLPKSQQTALDLRYNADLSLSEIAEEMGGISRQSVNDFLKKGKIRLTELEGILGNATKFRSISAELDRIETDLSELPAASDGRRRLQKSVKKIRSLINE